MLTLKDFDGKVLVSYLYEPDQYVAKVKYVDGKPTAILEVVKGKKRGVVVAIGANILGWSVCNTELNYVSGKGFVADVFDKEKGLGIALERANFVSHFDNSDRELYYEKVPMKMQNLFNKMKLDSEKYFIP